MCHNTTGGFPVDPCSGLSGRLMDNQNMNLPLGSISNPSLHNEIIWKIQNRGRKIDSPTSKDWYGLLSLFTGNRRTEVYR